MTGYELLASCRTMADDLERKNGQLTRLQGVHAGQAQLDALQAAIDLASVKLTDRRV